MNQPYATPPPPPQEADDPAALELPERPASSPHAYTIRRHYLDMECGSWTAERFRRLCLAWGETEAEMGARVGLSLSELRRRLDRNGFHLSEGILLTLHKRYIEALTTGFERPDELFPSLKETPRGQH